MSANGAVVSRGKRLSTTGHEQPIDDMALREGKLSYRLSQLSYGGTLVGGVTVWYCFDAIPPPQTHSG